jgi:hypothetical protein
LNYPERQTDRKKEKKKKKNNEEFCKKPTAPGVPKRSPIQVLSGSLSDSLSDSLSLTLSLSLSLSDSFFQKGKTLASVSIFTKKCHG